MVHINDNRKIKLTWTIAQVSLKQWATENQNYWFHPGLSGKLWRKNPVHPLKSSYVLRNQKVIPGNIPRY